MRILFLDDDQERHDSFKKRVGASHSIVQAFNVAQAKEALVAEVFDEAHLDHDLADYGPRDMYGGRDEYTGQHVALFIASLPAERRPKRIHIHSWNPDGGRAMQRILIQAGYRSREVSRVPFSFGRDR